MKTNLLAFVSRYLHIRQTGHFIFLPALICYTTTVSAQINIALGKPVTASSIIGATPASNLTDGSLTTVAGTSNTAVPPNAEWLQIDLGSDMLIENVRITANPSNHNRGRRFMIITWSDILGSAGLGANPDSYIGSGADVSIYNRLIYTNPASAGGGSPFGGAVPGAAGATLGPDYATLTLNIGVHYARYIRILALNDEPLELAEVELFRSTVVPQRDFTNGGFEQGTTAAGFTYVREAVVDGWSATEAVGMYTGNTTIPTSGSFIEFWRTGFMAVPSNQGNYFVELNAHTNGALSEEPICMLPGEAFTWSFAHRGRDGVDVMRLLINGVDVAEFTDNNAAAAPHTGTVLEPATTTITSTVPEASGWTQYTGTWTNTTGTPQSVIFTFRAVSAAGGSTQGNFLDDVSLAPLSALVTFSTSTSFGPEGIPTDNLPLLLINGTVTSPATVQINIAGGTATRGADYTTTPVAGTISVTIPAGTYDGTAATGISLAPYIQISTDGLSESAETILLDLQNPVGVAIPAAGGCVTGTVNNTFTIAAASDVTGNIFRDANGITNSLIDGPAYTGPQLYVNIVDVNGLVVASAPVNTITGAYSALGIASGNYSLQLSVNQGTVGSPAPLSIPATGWAYTGEGTGAGDGTPNGINTITATGVAVTANFGLNQLPVGNPATTTVPQPGVGDRLTLNGVGANPPALTGADPEDGVLGSGSTLLIDELPANTTLYYNNVAVTVGQVITGFNPALLQVEMTTATIGTTGTSFTFSFQDAAGINSAPVIYAINWAFPLPARLTSFNARLQAPDMLVSWQTTQEQNNDRFEIEYSTDGVAFKKAGTVKGSGTTTSLTAYDFLHKNAALLGAEALYYRLKQVDLDGHSTNSGIVKVLLQAGQASRLYPNPVQKGKPFLVTAPQIRNVSIVNMNGQQVWQNTYGGNRTTVNIPTSQLQKGTYVVYVNGEQLVGKIVVTE